MDLFLTGLGWVGAAGLLIAFFLNSSKRLSSDSNLYQLLNFAFASMLAVNAYYIGSIPFFIVNSFWAGIALFGMYKNRSKKH